METSISLRDLIETYNNLIKDGVALYGGGKRGEDAIQVLKNEGIEILCVGDQIIGKKIDGFTTIGIEEFVKREDVRFCIITPVKALPEIERRLIGFELIPYAFISWIKHFFPKQISIEQLDSCRPFGHYESPYPFEYDGYDPVPDLYDIDLNSENQICCLDWIGKGAAEYTELKKRNVGIRYRDNNMFSKLDSDVLFSIIGQYKPKNIIEIGSGYSTSVMLDANEFVMENSIKITCIEPDPKRLKSILKHNDSIEIMNQRVQDVPITVFNKLGENDVLFIDSSHVTRRGGDVPYEYFQIIPKLRKGVIIHIHDIHYPFEYCDDWVNQMRAYNEIYILRALLMNNNSYSIIFFNNYIEKVYSDLLCDAIPNTDRGNVPNGSIWLRKVL